jgi:hypothetical protein
MLREALSGLLQVKEVERGWHQMSAENQFIYQFTPSGT